MTAGPTRKPPPGDDSTWIVLQHHLRDDRAHLMPPRALQHALIEHGDQQPTRTAPVFLACARDVAVVKNRYFKKPVFRSAIFVDYWRVGSLPYGKDLDLTASGDWYASWTDGEDYSMRSYFEPHSLTRDQMLRIVDNAAASVRDRDFGCPASADASYVRREVSRLVHESN